MALSTRTKYVSAIISLTETKFCWEDMPRLFDLLRKFLEENGDEYGFILHNMDKLEDGTFKTPHIHIASVMKSAKRLSTWLRELCDFCEVGEFAVTIKKMVSLEGSLQYLIHKNNPEKAQYPIDFIQTNIDKDDLAAYLDDSTGLDFERLRSIIIEAKTKVDVIQAVGIGTYRAYRAVIFDLWDVLKARPTRVNSDGEVDLDRMRKGRYYNGK